MLNILVNDSFSTAKSGKHKKNSKKTKKSGVSKDKKKHKEASIMGYSAMEILQMKEAEKKLSQKPTATPVVYFKDFEKRFDELLVKNKTPRNDTISTLESKDPGAQPELDCVAQQDR